MMATVNGYLAFKYITYKELLLQDSTNSFALELCAKVTGVGSREWR
jgi:hypothetical protein